MYVCVEVWEQNSNNLKKTPVLTESNHLKTQFTKFFTYRCSVFDALHLNFDRCANWVNFLRKNTYIFSFSLAEKLNQISLNIENVCDEFFYVILFHFTGFWFSKKTLIKIRRTCFSKHIRNIYLWVYIRIVHIFPSNVIYFMISQYANSYM